MKKLYFFTALLCCISSTAQVNILPGNTVTQNFDAMGTSTTLPANWKMAASTSSPTWAAASGSVTQQASAPSPTTGGTYNWGSATTERAVGSMTSSGFASPNNLLAFFTNAGATNINGFTISYDAERYRINSAAASIQFYYSLNGSTWVAVSSADIATGQFVTGSSSYTFASPFTISKTGISITGFTITPGSNFYLRWNINTTGSNSQGIGIDNISITALGDAPPPTITAGTITGFGNVCVGANSTANSFTLSGSNLNGSQVTVGPLANYTLSGTANGPWTATLSPYYSGSSFSTTIYARLTPTAVQSYDGNIPISGGGAAAINLAVSGAGINTESTVATGSATSITQVSATIAGSITDIGCSAITAYGIEYSTLNGFANGTGTSIASANLTAGNFSSSATGLTAGTTYYYHAYATNSAGASYASQQSFTTSPVDPIIATAATDVTANSFVANWLVVTGAVNYRLDVATTNDFVFPGSVTLANWSFPNIADDAVVDLAIASNNTKIISAIGTNIPSFNTSAATTSAARATGWDGGSGTKYWQVEINTTGYYNLLLSSKQRSTSTGPKDFKAQYKIGAAGTWTDIPSATITVADNYTTGVLNNKALPDECNNQSSIFIRWIMTSNLAVGGGSTGSTGANLIDDILITGNLTSCVAGYENLLVNGIFQNVSGLIADATYFYRVRAFDGIASTVNSNTIIVTAIAAADLPVTLASFSGARKDNKNMLRWITLTENNNSGFEVQRSVDGTNYTAIGFVPAYFPDGNSNEQLTYAFNDHHYSGNKQYYRLKQIDKDGVFKFSHIVIIHSEKIASLSLVKLYPSLAASELNVLLDAPMQDDINFIITDLTGRVVKQSSVTVYPGSNNHSINVSELQSGCYLLKIISRKGNQTAVSRFMKQ